MGPCVRGRVCLLLALFLPSPSHQQDDYDMGNDYLVAELPGQQRDEAAFRPLSAREAMRQASRVAQKERSQETANFAILRQAGVPGAQRVAVYDVQDVTTSRYNFRRFRKITSWDQPRAEAADRLVGPSEQDQLQIKQFQQQQLQQQRQLRQQQSRGRPHTSNAGARPQQRSWDRGRPQPPRRKHRSSREKDHFKKLRDDKHSIHKRAADSPEVASKFELPPMSNEWNTKKKKKKKKKTKSITDAPTTKKMKASKRKRIFMESDELALGKSEVKNVTGSRTGVIKGISKELEDLLKDINEPEEYNPQLEVVQGTTMKAKFVPIPKNWQSPPSWKPQTRGPGIYARQGQVRRRNMGNIVTIGPQIISRESSEATDQGTDIEMTTSYGWRDPRQSQRQFEMDKESGLVLKPAPTDWPEPTHPPDGVYDWHKAQFRRAPRTRRPYVVHTLLSHAERERDYQFNKIQWTQWPTVAYTPWSRFRVTGEAISFRRNDMWQFGTKAPHHGQSQQQKEKSEWERAHEPQRLQPSEAQQLKSYGTLKKSLEHPPLTPGPPLETIDKNVVDLHHTQGAEVREGEDGGGGAGHEESHHQYQYNYGPQHASWQSSWQGAQKAPDGRQAHHQVHQTYYANYTNYYNYYYQNYYSQLENKTRAYHYEHSNHYQDRKQSSGHYQSHYRAQYQGKSQTRLRPPGYFYKPLQDEYAGNSHDLRAPLPTQPGPFFQQTTAWSFPRYRPHQRGSRWRYRGGRRPAGQHGGLFSAPLQRSQWLTTHRTL